jgi:hypothetical protein
VEAVCNPLIATLYPEDKTQKLTLFHAWFPGGIVIGGLLSYLLSNIGFISSSGHGWQIKMALILVPAVVYTFMIYGQKFPQTERVTAGISFSGMFVEAVRRPLFILIFVMMWLTAATELGPGAWIANIYKSIMGEAATAGILLLVWGNGLMYILRQFFSKTAHAVTPTGLIAMTAPLAAIGLFLFFRPFEVFADVVPFLGSLLGAGIAIFAGLVAAALTSVTIAISWLVFRPLLGIGLLVLAGGAVAALIYLARRMKKPAPSARATSA